VLEKKMIAAEEVNKHLQSASLAAEEKLAGKVTVLDLRGLASFTDYFLICHGRSERQVQAIADQVMDSLRDEKQRPLSVEGYRLAEWILIDYGDFVVHVFSESRREFYGLERLWSDAPVIFRSIVGKTREEAS
jgi:ribosome-associated protein